jgi:hypothetical protein
MYKRYPCPDPEIQAKIDALPKLNPEAKKAWVDALLSGEYKQTKGRLKARDRRAFCCLGVATDVAIQHGHVLSAKWYNGCFNSIDEGDESTFMPITVMEWLDSSNNDPEVYYQGRLVALSTLNDIHKLDFEMIAGIIINQL